MLVWIVHARVCTYLQAPVSIGFDHLNVWLRVIHEHNITSKQLSGTVLRDVSVGTSYPSTSFQPCYVGLGKCGCGQCVCHHTEAW